MTIYRRHNVVAKHKRAADAAAVVTRAQEQKVEHAAIAGRARQLYAIETEQGVTTMSDASKPADPNADVAKSNDPRTRGAERTAVVQEAAKVAAAEAADKDTKGDKPKGVTKGKDEEVSVHGTLTTRRELEPKDDDEPVTKHDKPHDKHKK